MKKKKEKAENLRSDQIERNGMQYIWNGIGIYYFFLISTITFYSPQFIDFYQYLILFCCYIVVVYLTSFVENLT